MPGEVPGLTCLMDSFDEFCDELNYQGSNIVNGMVRCDVQVEQINEGMAAVHLVCTALCAQDGPLFLLKLVEPLGRILKGDNTGNENAVRRVESLQAFCQKNGMTFRPGRWSLSE